MFFFVSNFTYYDSVQTGGKTMADQRKTARVLYLFEQFCLGNIVKKGDVAELFETSEKTIQRDISELNNYCSDMLTSGQGTHCGLIEYDRGVKGYRMLRQEQQWLSRQDILGISRILLESRAFAKTELSGILQRLAGQAEPQERKWIDEIIRNEQHHYQPPQHGKALLEDLWRLGQAVREKRCIRLNYRKDSAGKTVGRVVEPQSVIFSEFYFYLIAYIRNGGYESPAIYRLDRIESYEVLEERCPCRNEEKRFEDGEFRKRIQFMRPGKLLRLRLKFYGRSLEALLDRLPTAKVIERSEEYALIEAEVFGDGIVWWILSQGEFIEVLEPESLRQEVAAKLEKSLAKYR